MIFGKKRKRAKFVQVEENRRSHNNGQLEQKHDSGVFKQNYHGEKHHNENGVQENIDDGLIYGKGGRRKEDKAKETKGQKVVLHGLVSFCLMFIIFVVTLMCGFVGGDDAVETFKAYNGVIYQGSETNGKVALMINVYWGTEYLESMLETLAKHNAKATFFVGKTWAEENKDLLKKIYDAGHEIGNHGSNHKEHGRLGLEQNKSEIDGCTVAVKSILGINMTLFAPPGGSYNKHTTAAATSLGYKTILWTHDTIDWRDQNSKLIFNRATSEVRSGDLILMHPTKATSETFEDIIVAINGKKLALDTVSNTIND